MKKLLFTILFTLVLSGGAFANNHLILIQCKDDNPDLAFLQPIYEINLERKKVKVGMSEMIVARESTETELILVKSNPVAEAAIDPEASEAIPPPCTAGTWIIAISKPRNLQYGNQL